MYNLFALVFLICIQLAKAEMYQVVAAHGITTVGLRFFKLLFCGILNLQTKFIKQTQYMNMLQ
jgi:hypothetical protein